MMNKRGQSWRPFIWGIVIVVLIFVVGFLFSAGAFEGWVGNVEINSDTQPIGDSVGKSSWNWLTYIFGGVPTWLSNYNVSPTGAIIITIAIFFLIFITFGDVIQNFSTFSPPVAWITAFLMAIVAANLKFTVSVMSVAIGIFAPLGGIAVIAGLAAAFVAFFGVNWGIGSIGPWLIRRRAMMRAERMSTDAAAGAEMAAAGIGVAQTMAKASATGAKKGGKVK